MKHRSRMIWGQSSDISIYRQLAHALRQGPVVVATVISSQGSVPREVGAKLILCADGQLLHTIGGGAGEAKVLLQAKSVLATGIKQQLTVDLSGAPHREIQGICGGQMQVWLERWQGETAIALVDEILAALKSSKVATLVTPLQQARSPYLITTDSGVEPFPMAFCERLCPPPTLLIVGAGHCGIELAKVADLMGFQVVVQDDRPEWANSSRFPQAIRHFTEPMTAVVAALAPCEDLYVALVTRGFDYDLQALKVLLERDQPCRYIGMIGSEKRVHRVFQALLADGVPKPLLQAVYAPIGLDIGALTPQEIAVSIGAELIMVRRGGTGMPLSQRRHSAVEFERL